jgi:hypothetical protein
MAVLWFTNYRSSSSGSGARSGAERRIPEIFAGLPLGAAAKELGDGFGRADFLGDGERNPLIERNAVRLGKLLGCRADRRG